MAVAVPEVPVVVGVPEAPVLAEADSAEASAEADSAAMWGVTEHPLHPQWAAGGVPRAEATDVVAAVP